MPFSLCFWCFPAAALGGAALSILIVFLFSVMSSARRPSSHSPPPPPGSRGLPLIGETIQFMAAVNSSNGVYDFVRIRCLRYGRCFKTRIFGETHVFVSSTESAKQILNDSGVNYTKKYIRSIAELVGHRSLLCASHLDHKFLRSHLINLFSTSFLASFVTQFDQQIVEALRGWESGSTIVLLNQALKITCKAMCKMLMSIQNDDELELLQKEVAHVCEAMLAFPWRFPGTRFHNGLKARRRIIKILEKMIRERRRSEAWHDDFLQRLLTEEGDDSRGALLDVEIGDNILTMLIAGQDTTASAITWMVKFLDENPDVLQNLKDEQFEILNKQRDRDRESCFLTLEDLGNMCYAPKVVKESLRLASVVPWFPRLVLQDSQIQGYKVNEGWNVNIDVRSLHSHPSIYHHPLIFNPSRFDEEAKPYSFLAFGKLESLNLKSTMATHGFPLTALFLLCFLGFSHGHIHLSSIPRNLEVTASPKSGQVLKAGVDKISVSWVLNGAAKVGSDLAYKSVKVKLCYAPVSQVDRAWRKTEDDLAKDKTCQFQIVEKPYNPSNKTVQKAEWTVERDTPTATFFVRAYAFNSAGDEVAYGQTTDEKKGTNLFQVEAITGRHISLDIASGCFSAFSVLSLTGFFIAGKRQAKKAAAAEGH